MYEYRMLPLPDAVAKHGASFQRKATLAADALAEFANTEASEGWEFHRIDTFTTYEKGCWSSLTGGNKVVSQSTHYVATFRRPKQ